MNFTSYVIKPEDGEWGVFKEDGTWSGMVGMLIQKEIDICIADLTITIERSQVISFGEPITEIFHSLFIMNPSDGLNMNAYIEPLHFTAWISIGIFCFLLPLFMHLSSRKESQKRVMREFSLFKSSIFTFSSLTNRGWSHMPTKLSGKLVFGTILYFGILIYWHWEAMLISHLASRYVNLPFNDIPELLDNTNYR